MPRRSLQYAAGVIFHVLNRSAKRVRLFFNEDDYHAFERALGEALDKHPTRLLASCVMPNHWHLVLWPVRDELPRFMHWLTTTHARRWQDAHGSSGMGHVYQNRYRAIPVQDDLHLMTLLRYVERNPVRGGLVSSADAWRWGSLWQRCNSGTDIPLTEWPIAIPPNWVDTVNAVQHDAELARIRAAICDGRPLGDADWGAATAERIGLSTRSRGRPKKMSPAHFPRLL